MRRNPERTAWVVLYSTFFVWCALAAASYIGHGYADPALMIPASIGSCSGGYLGSRIASLRGAGFVRVLFIVVGLALGLKLLFGL